MTNLDYIRESIKHKQRISNKTMDTPYQTTTHPEASRLGFVPITSGYQDDEYDHLDRALALLNGIKYMLVTSYEGIQIYRKQLEVNIIKERLD